MPFSFLSIETIIRHIFAQIIFKNQHIAFLVQIYS